MSASNVELFFDACYEGNFLEVKRLFAAGARIDMRRNKELGIAARHGHLDVVRFLLDNGADIDLITNVSGFDLFRLENVY